MSNRTAIATALMNSSGWVSGEKLARTLGISRAAVSKHVQALDADGYRIERAPRRGYRLNAAPDRLLPELILALPAARRLCRGGVIHRLSTGSTNADARALAADGAVDGTLVTAEEQTAGKGRLGRDWASPAGCGIYASLILRPAIPLHRIPLLTLLTAVATAEAVIDVTGLPVRIKWPNDLLVNGRKFAGVLTEAVSEVDIVECVIIGFGINVNTPLEALPERAIYPATSILAELGHPADRLRILTACLERFGHWYRLLESDPEPLLQRWTALAGMAGRRVSIRQHDTTLSGVVTGIDPDGALRLTAADGSVQKVYHGDILP